MLGCFVRALEKKKSYDILISDRCCWVKCVLQECGVNCVLQFDDNKLWDLKKQKFICMKPSRLFWSYAVTAANITNGEYWSRKETKSTASCRISISSGLCRNNVTCENTHMSKCWQILWSPFEWSINCIRWNAKFQKTMFLPKSIILMVLSSNYRVYKILSMTLHYHYCMTVNSIRVPY